MPRDDAALLDILHAAKRAQRFVAGMSREEFAADEKTRSAVLHQLMILGEAAKRIPSAYRAAHPKTPWRRMAGTRDTLIHEYDEAIEAGAVAAVVVDHVAGEGDAAAGEGHLGVCARRLAGPDRCRVHQQSGRYRGARCLSS